MNGSVFSCLYPDMCIYGWLFFFFFWFVYLVADSWHWIGNGVFWSVYLYISPVKPCGPEPASVAIATNGLKGYFPLKDKPQWGVGEGGGWLQLPVTPQVKPGSMHRLFVCVCECVCGCTVWSVCVCERSNVKLYASQWRKKKVFADCSHVWYVNLYFLFIWACLEVLARGKLLSTKRFSSRFKRRIRDEIEATTHKHAAVQLSSFHPVV